ncbi:E3 ubiquitin-protein ligase RNF14 [Hordeum vulgare]|nr:E3 ubiquitin-protein ligase RNF14 [Hordeum vulgare]
MLAHPTRIYPPYSLPASNPNYFTPLFNPNLLRQSPAFSGVMDNGFESYTFRSVNHELIPRGLKEEMTVRLALRRSSEEAVRLQCSEFFHQESIASSQMAHGSVDRVVIVASPKSTADRLTLASNTEYPESSGGDDDDADDEEESEESDDDDEHEDEAESSPSDEVLVERRYLNCLARAQGLGKWSD